MLQPLFQDLLNPYLHSDLVLCFGSVPCPKRDVTRTLWRLACVPAEPSDLTPLRLDRNLIRLDIEQGRTMSISDDNLREPIETWHELDSPVTTTTTVMHSMYYGWIYAP
jgi:hypothetical protein